MRPKSIFRVRHRRSALCRATAEPLERRRLLSLDAPEAVATFDGGPLADTITLDYVGDVLVVEVSGQTWNLVPSQLTGIVLNGLGGNDWINIERNAGVPVTVNGGAGDDTVHLSYWAENLGNLPGELRVFGGSEADRTAAWDRGSTPRTHTFDSAWLRRTGFGGVFYGADVETFDLYNGTGGDTTLIPSTWPTTTFHLFSSGGSDRVEIANASVGLNDVTGPIQVLPSAGQTTVWISDAGNLTGKTATLQRQPSGYERLSGLSFGNIEWNPAGVDDVYLTTGGGADTVNVMDTYDRVYLNSAGGLDRVNVGNSYNGVADINFQLQVDNSPSYTTLLIDDGPNLTARTATLDTVINGSTYNALMGMSSGAVMYDSADIDQVTIRAGSGADTLNIRRSSEVLTITNAAGNDTVNLGNPATGVQDITGPLHVMNPPAYTALNISDAGDTLAHPNIRLDVDGPRGTLTGLAPAMISWNTADIAGPGQGITLTTGNIADTVTVARLQTGIRLTDPAGGADLVRIGDATLGAAQISATIVLDNPFGYTQVAIDDQAGATARNVTFDHTTLGGLEYGRVTGFSPVGGELLYKLDDTLSPVVYRGGSGDDAYTVARAKIVGLQVFGGGGNDDFYIGGSPGGVAPVDANVTLNGEGGDDECWVLDASATDNGGFTVDGAIIQRPGMSDLRCYGMDNLYLYGGGGADKIHRIVDTLPGYAVYLYDGPSFDHVYVDRTSGAPVYVLQTSTGDSLSVGYNPAVDGATVILPSPVTYLGYFELAKNALLTVGLPGEGLSNGQKVLFTESYLLNNPSRLDLGAHSMVVEYETDPSIDIIRSDIALGYNNGTWDGWALWSRFADAGRYGLGYALSSDLYGAGGGAFHGVPVDSTAVLVSFTRYGDTNLDRTVNIADFSRLAANFNRAGTSWLQGNFNYDTTTNIADFSLLAGNFNRGVPVASGVFGERLIDDVV